MRIAVFASGRGTNFEAIVKARKKGIFKASLSLLVCDQPKAGVIAKARRAGVKVVLVRREDFSGKKDFEAQIIKHIQEDKINLIVMAGFMRMLSPEFVRRYRNRVINIHPSLLPSFKGAHAIKDAFGYGVKVTGVTVHFVDEKMDHGPIILQQVVSVSKSDTLVSLEARIHKIEHKLYSLGIKLFVEGKLKIKGRKVSIQ
ncbi:MAG: phosphoribosylglycinamide formyltransferase [Candidatus Omnitrophica bacterium]|nr:phosphoribosylglycinamide formyltransferase [Candidatus Omnitrophota bacterium]